MARTAQNLLDRVRVITGDKLAAQFTDVDILAWANDGQQTLIKRAELGITDYTTNSIVGTGAYAVAGGFLWAKSISYNGVILPRVSESRLDVLYPYRRTTPLEQGTPTCVWLTKDTINVWPVPDTVNLIIAARICPRPADLINGASSIAIADDDFEILVRYCLQQAKEWDGDAVGAAYFKQDVKERTADAMYDAAMLGNDTYPSVQELDEAW